MRFLIAYLGLLAGGALGTMLGAGVGWAAAQIGWLRCVEANCGYAIILVFAPTGIILGAPLGGILAYRRAGRRYPGRRASG